MLSCSPSLLEFAHRQPAGSANSHSRRQTRKNAAFAGGCTPVKADSQRGCNDPKRKLAQGTTNHLYSVAAITNTAGQVVERYSYNAYGVRTVKNPANVVIAKSVVGNDRGFTSYKLDGETRLYFARGRMYSPSLGRFTERDPVRYARFDGPRPADGYYDGINLYMAYFVPGLLDPDGMGVCHIFVYLPKDRKLAGDMFVYNDKGVLRCYFPVRGDGSGGGPLENNGDTPTGDYDGKIIPPATGDGPNGPFGANERVALDPKAGQALDAKNKGRSGLQIHGGRQDRAQDKTGTVYDPTTGDPVKGQKFKCPMGTHGCVRTYEPNQDTLIKCMKDCDKCDSWEVHVREGNPSGNMMAQPTP